MGIFVAGVLSGLGEPVRERVHSVYGTSSGADAGAYFVSGQTDKAFNVFHDYLTRPEFIRGDFWRYVLELLFFEKTKIKNYVDVEYVVKVARDSDCRFNLEAFEHSSIGFFVKVIDIESGRAHYLPGKKDVFRKLMATSQCGPLSTKAYEIDGMYCIDGGTIPSVLDIELVRGNPDKQFIFIRSQKESRFVKLLLYPMYLLAGHILTNLYGRAVGRMYIRNLFADYSTEIRALPNLRYIENDLRYSSFCTNKPSLKKSYERGIEMGKLVASEFKLPIVPAQIARP